MRYLIFATALLLAATSVAADVEHKFQATTPRGAVQRVVIDIPYGSFTVRNSTGNVIAVSGIASRDYDGGREKIWAQKVVDDTSVEIRVNGAEATLRRKFGKNAQSFRAKKFTDIDLRIDVPVGMDVQFETSAGEIDMAGDFGDVNVDLRAGEVELTLPRAKVRELNASCRVGEVRAHLGHELVTREGLLPGRTHFFNAAGRTHVNVHVTAGEVDVTLTK